MNPRKKPSLTGRLIWSFVLVGTIPMAIIAFLSVQNVRHLGAKQAESFQTAAHSARVAAGIDARRNYS